MTSARALRTRRFRRRVAYALLGWATTFATVALAAQWFTAAVATPASFAPTAERLAGTAAVRGYLADQLVDAAGGTGNRDQLAAALDTDAVAVLLNAARSYSFDGGPAPQAGLATLAPGFDPALLGATDDQDVVVALQTPQLSWAAAWLPRARTGAGLGAFALLFLAVLFAPIRPNVLRHAGRWAVGAAVLTAAVTTAVPVLVGRSGAVLAVFAAALTVAAAPSLYALQGVLGGVGVAAWAGSRSLQRRTVASITAAAEAQLENENRPVAAAATGPYWLRPNHPIGIEVFQASELTDGLDNDELRQIATATARAWIAGPAADPDDAALLKLLLADRGTHLQVARLWERYGGLPAQTATVVLAYSDLGLYGAGYAELLGLPEWEFSRRARASFDLLRHTGLDTARTAFAGTYDALSAAAQAAGADDEARRLAAIAARLR